jgi:hypothetical protein
MKRKFTLLSIALLFGSLTAFSQIIISQVYEGTSNNKYIEITNVGSTAVDLASPQLIVKLFSNKSNIGANAPTYVDSLVGTLNSWQSLVIRHPSAALPAYATTYTPGHTDNVCNFNGTGTGSPVTNTDIIALYNGTTLQDVFAWGTFVYTDLSFYRDLSVTSPNATWTIGEWIQLTLAAVDNALPNTPERLGYHGTPSTTPILDITSPANGSTVYGSNANITFSLYNFVMGTSGHIHYKVDGGSDNEHTTTMPVALTGLSSGSHTVKLTLVDPSHNPLTPDISDSVTFNVNLTLPNIKTIYQIQYTIDTSGNSPYKDSIVTTTGIVTASYSGGYFIQVGVNPWNGLFVFDNTNLPSLGDSILLTGTVSEYYKCTELKTITAFNVVAWGKPLPTPVSVTTTSVQDEQYEGMLVNLNNAICTYVSASGWWKVLQGTDTCEIGKLMFPYTSAVVGTHYNVTGLVNFTFNLYTVEPRNVNDIQFWAGINENKETFFVIYPNPVTDKLFVELNSDCQYICIFDLYGRLIKNVPVNNESRVNVDLSDLNSGCYFISIINKGNFTGQQVIIKK